MTDKGLETIFHKTAQGQAGECPLPEPGRGAPHLEHPALISIRKQPKNYNYDQSQNREETKRFKKLIEEALNTGQISEDEALLLQKIE